MDILNKILLKEHITAQNIQKVTSGFTFQVYFVDNYVVKLTNDRAKFDKIKKETCFYKNCELNFIPSYVASGKVGGYGYLIITKVEGKPLYSIWHTLSRAIQSKIVSKIVVILKTFHAQNAGFLDKKFIYKNWLKYFAGELKSKEKELKELGYNTDVLNNVIKNHVPALFKNNVCGLVYNDAHFDNFLYDNGRLNLIDFDRVIYAPLDYELLIFKTMCDDPAKFASEEDYKKCAQKDYNWIYDQFKKEYSELFNNFTDTRVKLYQFNYLMEQALKTKKRTWIKSLLLDLDEYFKKVVY